MVMFCPCLGHRRWFSYINRLLFIFYKKISPIITNAPPNDHHRQTSRKAPNRTFSDDKSLGPSGPSQTKVFARKTDEGWILNYRPMTSSSSRRPLCVGIGRIGRRGRKYRNGKCIRALWDAKGYVYEEVLLVKWFVSVFFSNVSNWMWWVRKFSNALLNLEKEVVNFDRLKIFYVIWHKTRRYEQKSFEIIFFISRSFNLLLGNRTSADV